MKLRITLNVFAPWVIWPLATYSRRVTEPSREAKEEVVVETLAVTPLFLSIELGRRTTRPRQVAK